MNAGALFSGAAVLLNTHVGACLTIPLLTLIVRLKLTIVIKSKNG